MFLRMPRNPEAINKRLVCLTTLNNNNNNNIIKISLQRNPKLKANVKVEENIKIWTSYIKNKSNVFNKRKAQCT